MFSTRRAGTSGPVITTPTASVGYNVMVPVPVPVPAAGAFVNIPGPYVASTNTRDMQETAPGSGVLEYTGASTTEASFYFVGTIDKAGASPAVFAALRFALNDAGIPGMLDFQILVVMGIPLFAGNADSIELRTGDTVRVQIANLTDADDFSIFSIKFGALV